MFANDGSVQDNRRKNIQLALNMQSEVQASRNQLSD